MSKSIPREVTLGKCPHCGAYAVIPISVGRDTHLCLKCKLRWH